MSKSVPIKTNVIMKSAQRSYSPKALMTILSINDADLARLEQEGLTRDEYGYYPGDQVEQILNRRTS
jgi:hypothetical protein